MKKLRTIVAVLACLIAANTYAEKKADFWSVVKNRTSVRQWEDKPVAKADIEDLLRAAAARGERRVVMVGHGGTMMASLSRFADDDRAYWEWLVGNCKGYRIQVDLDEGELRFAKVELLDYDSL